MMIQDPDIAAMADVLDGMAEDTDSLSVEAAVALRESVIELRRRAATLLGLIDTQLVSVLESPREFNGIRYSIVNDGKWRPMHSKIKAAVKRDAVAIDTETGEMRSAAEAVDHAVETMYALFVSPSTFPKTGGLDDLSLDKGDVGRFEVSGRKVSTEEVRDG